MSSPPPSPPTSSPTQGRRSQHHLEDEAKAYHLQILGAREGAIKGTLLAGTIVALCNWRFPFMRRQTLAGKAFLVSWGTIFGMVTYADKYLLAWEAKHRFETEMWRDRARRELAGKGIVPSESTMREWKRKKDEVEDGLVEAREVAESKVLRELEKVKHVEQETT